jgi:hypothetical protein
MNAAELLAALSTVEKDHEMVLKKVRELKNAVSRLLDPDKADVPAVIAQLRDLNEYFALEFSEHSAEEETTLFPLLERHAPDGPALVARLRKDHREICLRREEFANCLTVALEVEDELPRMVVRDLLTDGWALWEMLDKHAHDETQAAHAVIALSMA